MIVLHQKLPPLILASTSRYRRELLERLGRPFRVEKPAVLEDYRSGETPALRAVRLAREKADAVAQRYPDALVIGSDQVCALGDTILDKAGNRGGQEAQLAALAGRSADFHTAVCLRSVAVDFRFEHLDLTRCVFRQLTNAIITDYATREPALDCAGGFKVEGLGISLLERVESLDPSALVGLPLIGLCAGLAQFANRS
jgi:septum formation protein